VLHGLCYWSQIDGFWRFAAPPSFSSLLLAPEGRLAVFRQDKEKPMPIGTVKFFNLDKGYGFIQPEGGGNDAFVHISAVERAGMATLDRDQRVSYELEEDRRGKTSAVNLQSA
jgi:CspA family cold shock protein